jgi:hypothetical protein
VSPSDGCTYKITPQYSVTTLAIQNTTAVTSGVFHISIPNYGWRVKTITYPSSCNVIYNNFDSSWHSNLEISCVANTIIIIGT